MFDQLKGIFGELDDCGDVVLGNCQRLAFGAVSGVGATIVTYPLDLIQTRQIASKSCCSAWRMTMTILSKEGPRGLFRGGLTSVVGVIPYEGVQFAVYETLKSKNFRAQRPNRFSVDNSQEMSILDSFLAGSVAGAVGQTVSYPLDVMRTRLAVEGGYSASGYKGMYDCLKRIVAEEGLSGLFRGNAVSLVSVVPRAAVMFCSYEAAVAVIRSS